MARTQNPSAAMAVILTAVLAGCTSDAVNEQPDSPQAEAEQDAAQASEWTAGIIDQAQSDAPVSKLVAVRTTTHDGFDRVVLEFDERVPGYHTEYIDQPIRKCGSGKVTQMAGDGWLELRMYPANAHTSEGQPTIAERERMLDLPVLSELELTCDFEAVVTWVLGVESPNRYRVRELSGPPRLVIDIKH
ncbi:MAG: AMIN-like domain-containing (lipo)protein [Pseudomonadota bacterium]